MMGRSGGTLRYYIHTQSKIRSYSCEKGAQHPRWSNGRQVIEQWTAEKFAVTTNFSAVHCSIMCVYIIHASLICSDTFSDLVAILGVAQHKYDGKFPVPQ